MIDEIYIQEPRLMLSGSSRDYTRYMATRWPPQMLSAADRRRAANDPELVWRPGHGIYGFRYLDEQKSVGPTESFSQGAPGPAAGLERKNKPQIRGGRL